MTRPSLDESDEIEVSHWLGRLRVHLNVRDLLRPPHQRELGPVLARQNHATAYAAIVDALNFAGTPEPTDRAGKRRRWSHTLTAHLDAPPLLQPRGVLLPVRASRGRTDPLHKVWACSVTSQG